MKAAHATIWLVLLVATNQQKQLIPGTLNDRLSAEGTTGIELQPSEDRHLPDLSGDDRVFKVRTPQFRPAGAPAGLIVALVESSGGAFLFVDTNVDGQLTASERIPYSLTQPREVSLTVTPAAAAGVSFPFRCRVLAEERNGKWQRFLWFTASFRAEGYAEIGGRRTLVSLPFNAMQGTVDVRRGPIGVDINGDGNIDFRGLSSPEVIFARNERVIFRVADRYISVEAADFAERTFFLREHSPEEYTYVEIRAGAPLPDFTFTDFDGRTRKLSDFKGKYLLLDVWGTWCGPCVADVPFLQAAYDRFRDRGFEILGLDFEHGASTETVRAFLKTKGVTWPNATSESVKDLIEKRFRITAFPTVILLDRDGLVVETSSSALRGKALMGTLERILDRREPVR
jgi:thiol-disulfide isomerase/thioredoxin